MIRIERRSALVCLKASDDQGMDAVQLPAAAVELVEPTQWPP